MCFLTSYVFHHVCAHSLTITTPSLNPRCGKQKIEYEYLEDYKCPKCRLWSDFKDFERDEWGTGVLCGGFTGKTTRNVVIGREQFVIETTKVEIWERRREWLRSYNAWMKDKEYVAWSGIRGDEEGLEMIGKTYFLTDEATNEEFFAPVGDVDLEDTLVKCWCQGGRYVDDVSVRRKQEQDWVALPCCDVCHATCIKAHFATSNICPACNQAFSVMRAKPEYLPSNFEREMLDDILGGETWYKKGSVVAWMVDACGLVALLAFMYWMPLWICWIVVFVGFVMATWDEMDFAGEGGLRLEGEEGNVRETSNGGRDEKVCDV